jgi:hypothetical protein
MIRMVSKDEAPFPCKPHVFMCPNLQELTKTRKASAGWREGKKRKKGALFRVSDSKRQKEVLKEVLLAKTEHKGT